MNTRPALTMIEAVVTIGITSVIMVVIVNSVLFFYRANASSLEQSFQIESARKGVELMVRDLREVTTADDGSYPLASIASTSITFYSDTDLDASVEKITYTLSTTTLTRQVVDTTGNPSVYSGVGTTSVVSTYVRNLEESRPIFHYFMADGTEVASYADVNDVRFVEVNLVVNVLPIRAPQEFTLRSSATLRNLRE